MGQRVSYADACDREAIGTHGLTGIVGAQFITIQGPCGQGHTMNFEAAAELRDWLDAKLRASQVRPSIADIETALAAGKHVEILTHGEVVIGDAAPGMPAP